MPKYEFKCGNCSERFEISMSIKDKESTKVLCPKCKSEDVSQIYSSISVNTKYSGKNAPNGCCGDCKCCGLDA